MALIKNSTDITIDPYQDAYRKDSHNPSPTQRSRSYLLDITFNAIGPLTVEQWDGAGMEIPLFYSSRTHFNQAYIFY